MIYSDPKLYVCSNCKKIFVPGNVACLVAHVGNGCCHYGDTEVPTPNPTDTTATRVVTVGTVV
jgi:hypothetical protein